jgi:Fe(3+) dicitrate transport protein
MKIKLLIIISLCTIKGFTQTGKISGVILDENKDPIPYTSVFLKNIDKVIYTNEYGFFSTQKLKYGDYLLEFQSIGYENLTKKINIISSMKYLDKLILKEKTYNLEEFEIIDQNEFNIRKLRAIEGVMITQGKKTEAINVENTDANKATNQSRQIYAKIPGLNIWESDGAGIQLGLGGRGLNPSRTSNFNTRQNGYDISADALGYPESYYTPPSEAVDEIQLIRGAASLQFGPQFGGLVNFKLKEGHPNKKIEAVIRNTIGSYGLNNTFLSIGGTSKNWSYYGYGNYKFGDDFRANSSFDVKSGYVKVNNKINNQSSLSIEFTKMYYLAQQPGGLTDKQFKLKPDTSVRERNWFEVDWNLFAIQYDLELNSNTKFNSRTFGLIASRKAVGNLDKPFYIDFMQDRNIISGEFNNIGNESRLIHLYEFSNNPSAFLIGARIYKGFNNNIQANGNNLSTPDFNFTEDVINMNDSSLSEATNYKFPSLNIALFGENIFNINNKLSVTPGFRYEYISTSSDGIFRRQELDNANNILFDTVLREKNNQSRDFTILGIGINYKLKEKIEVYSNFSQNYRSINFSDMQITNPNFQINPELKDERGYNFDLGIRGSKSNKLYFDASLYYLFYNNRIGTVWVTQNNISNFNNLPQTTAPYFQLRTNVSQSRTMGYEMMIETDWWKILINENSNSKLSTFINFSFNDAKYIDSDEPAYNNKKVELVPPISIKSGLSIGNEKYSLSYQFSYTKEHFSDATNSESHPHGIVGLIPTYYIMDFSGKVSIKKMQVEFGINNITNINYFTRRATGYPGPGIIPSMPRNFYICIQIKI